MIFCTDAQRQTVKKQSQSYPQIYKNTCKKNKVFVNLVMEHLQGISRNQLQVVPLEEDILAISISNKQSGKMSC